MLDEYARYIAVLLQDGDACLILGETWIDSRVDPLAQVDHRRRQHDIIAELPFTGDAFHKRNGDRTIDAEFAFEAGRGFPYRRDLHHARMHRNVNAIDRLRHEALAHAQLQGAVDRRMQHKPAREWLVGVVQNLPAAVAQRRKPALAGEHIEPSRFRFERLFRCREASACEQCCSETILRRTSRMAVDAHYGYYGRRTLRERLAQDVVLPARSRYREVWLVGISMGGMGALSYVAQYPDHIARALLLAPYLGETEWMWRWIRDQPAHPRLYLGYGSRDRFAAANRHGRDEG